MRLHLFEFEDLSWFPAPLRDGGTDYLRYLLAAIRLYEPVVPLLGAAMKETGQSRIVDLCSGGGGYCRQLATAFGNDVSITLTDKFPDIGAFTLLKEQSDGRIDFVTGSVDAQSVPRNLKGFRVMFSAAHHFRPAALKAVLGDAVRAQAPIALFDGERNYAAIIGMILLHPLAFLLFTPFFRPFRFSRVFFTYIIPLIPLYTIWDGCVSILRIYRPVELLRLTESTGRGYRWKAGRLRNRFGIPCTYLIGVPLPATNPG